MDHIFKFFLPSLKVMSTLIDTQFASRNCLLDEKTNFNNFKEILNEDVHKKSLENVKNFLLKSKYNQT